jgi:hypothetical protein
VNRGMGSGLSMSMPGLSGLDAGASGAPSAMNLSGAMSGSIHSLP